MDELQSFGGVLGGDALEAGGKVGGDTGDRMMVTGVARAHRADQDAAGVQRHPGGEDDAAVARQLLADIAEDADVNPALAERDGAAGADLHRRAVAVAVDHLDALARRVADLDLLWFEEPVNAKDIDAYLEVKGKTPMAIAGGVLVVAVVAVAYFGFYYPPTTSEGTGAIGAVEKHRADQIGVVGGEPPLQQLPHPCGLDHLLARLAGAPMVRGAGVDLHAKVGDAVQAGQPLYTIYADFGADFQFSLEAAAQRSGFSIG